MLYDREKKNNKEIVLQFVYIRNNFHLFRFVFGIQNHFVQKIVFFLFVHFNNNKEINSFKNS